MPDQRDNGMGHWSSEGVWIDKFNEAEELRRQKWRGTGGERPPLPDDKRVHRYPGRATKEAEATMELGTKPASPTTPGRGPNPDHLDH
jgi:hypothetical protein